MGFENLKIGKSGMVFSLWSTCRLHFLGLLVFLSACQFQPTEPDRTTGPVITKPVRTDNNYSLAPEYVWETLEYIEQYDKAPPDFVGGREFQNRERRLPLKDVQQQTIRYREWDVHPKISGQNRGPERLVTGSDQSAWYTRDHYNHFTKLK
jgi:ribonuclease T1